MTTRSYYRNRPTPTINEQHNAQQLARYLAHHLHPLIAAILAYEDATRTSQGTGDRIPAERRNAA